MPGSASRHLFHYLRPAKFTRPVAWSKIERQRRQEQAAKYRTPIADTMPQLSEAIDTVIELIMRDYVTGWMRAITPEVVLQQRLEELLRIILIRLKTRVMDLDLTQLLVTRLVPKVTAHVNDFRKAEMALRGNSLERSLTESDELDIMVAGKFRSGRLHKALSTSISTKATEEAYLRNVVQAILPTLLPASEMHSEILRHLLRELLVCAVLRPIMDLLSDPDYWNQNVDLYIGKAIREQNMVKKLREALKQHTDHMDAGPNAVDSETAPSGSGADIYSFEDFLKMIKRCDSLLDVKRIRNTIMTQMRKKKAQIVGRDKDDIVNGNKVEDIIIYINRLDIAKRNAEKRIEKLGGPAYPKRHTRDYTPEIKNLPTLINLDVVLTNPSGLSYFMEFLDQRDNMNELQFWLLIDTLNIKVEGEHRADTDSANVDGHPEYKSSIGAPSSTLSRTQGQKAFEAMTPASMSATAGLNLPSGMANSIRSSRKASIATIDITDTLRDDVRMIYETYFAESAPRPVVIDHSLVDIFRDFALSEGASSSNGVVGFDVESKNQEDAKAAIVRQKLLEAQKQVFNQMLQKDYPEFARSDLYFKFLTSYQNSIVEQEEEARGHKSLATPKPSNGAALFSVIGLGSPEKRRAPSETSKRSSTGSFLDIFGLGRDKDKDREQLPHARLKHTETSLRSSMLLTNDSRSKSSSPISTRTIDSGDSSSQSSMQPHETKAKQILEVSSPAKSTSQPLVRSRSFSSLSAPEASFDNDGRVIPKSSYMNSSFEKGHTRDASLDFTDNEGLSKSTMGREDVRLSDSLLLELQTNEEDDEGLIGDSQGGLPIPRMPSNRNGNGNVIDAAEAVEAILSSIMETQDTQQEDLANSKLKEKGADIAPMDPTDPSFSTARDNRVGSEALLEWGKSHKKSTKRRFKEKTLETGKTVRVSSRNTSESDQKSLGSIFESQKSQAKHNADSDRQNISDKLALSEEDQDYGERGTTRKDDDFMSDDDNDDDNDDDDDPNGPNPSSPLNNAVLAAPGDLLLSARIKRLEQDIENVRKQEAIVMTLIQKAERQGRQNELRILKKSKSALRREILGMEYQKTQYEVQEEENMIMPGRSTITITSSTVGHEGSKEFALYVIEVHQMAQDGSFASGWVIARRYSEFFSLNQQLREKYPSIVRQYELPGKRGFLKLQKSFVEGRRIGLERYLQCLVQHIEICQSQELRAFLSQENVALPQFSAASSILSYSLFDSDSQSKDSSKSAASSPSTNQFFFEQLFNSATSPLTSPTIARDPSSVLTLSNAGSAILDASGRQSFDGLSNADQNEGFMKHIYQTVSDGIDDMFGGPPTVLGNITKQLGNQMIQFTMENDDVDEKAGSSSSTGMRRRHGSHGERDSVRLVQSEIIDRVAVVSQTTDPIQPSQRPLLQRVQSSRSRRLSSPDPHTQHQRLLLQRQQQEQKQIVQRQRQESQQQQQPQQQDVPQQQQQQQSQRQQQQTRQGVVEPEGVTTFTAPLCDLFIELFELKDKNNWLRRQAVVIILQQVLGGTIERKLRDTIKAYVEESMLTFYVLKLRDALWPPTPPTSPTELSGGYEVVGEDLRVSPTMPKSGKEGATDATKKTIRTPEQKASTKDQANRKLSAFLPELLGNMVGHQNARRGARRVFAAFQNRRLNQQLVYTTLDEVIEAMWPELALSSSSYSPITTSLGVQHGASAPATTGLSSNFANLSSNAAYSKISSMEANAATISDSGERSSSSRVTSRSGSRKYK
ncbi:Intermediate filament protein [Haplosporangium sp. Z 27]|nr:Intermediate filament protein [Haplosporangium sp. Z 27]